MSKNALLTVPFESEMQIKLISRVLYFSMDVELDHEVDIVIERRYWVVNGEGGHKTIYLGDWLKQFHFIRDLINEDNIHRYRWPIIVG